MHYGSGTAAPALNVSQDPVTRRISAEYLPSGYLCVTGAGRGPRSNGRQWQVSVKGVELHPGFCKFPFQAKNKDVNANIHDLHWPNTFRLKLILMKTESFCKGSFQFFDALCLQVNHSCLSEVESLLMDLEAANRALLHPLVVIWVS